MRRLELSAGIMLSVGGAAILAGIFIAQALFPGYDASAKYISDLGAPIELVYSQSPGLLTIEQPSSAIFIGAALLFSILILGAGRFLRGWKVSKWFSRFLTFAGIGMLFVFVSYVPYYVYAGRFMQGNLADVPPALGFGALLHFIGAIMLFVLGGLSVIASRSAFEKPASLLSLALGMLIITAFVLNVAQIDFGLDTGGMERLAAYPFFLWTIAFGVFLYSSGRQMAQADR